MDAEMNRPLCLFAVLLPFTLLPVAVGAEAFDTITLSVFAAANTNENAFHEFWDPKMGGRIEVETPFYAGDVRLGVHYFKSSSRAGDVRAFRTTSLYLAWGEEWGITRGLSWGLAGQGGVSVMDASDAAFGNRKLVESELAFGASTRLKYAMLGQWCLCLSADYQKVLTRRRIELMFVAVGVGRSFSSPNWFRRFFE